MTLEKRIETICEYMPDGWRIRIDLEKHSGTVTAIRPDGTEVDMGNGDNDLEEQVGDALHLAFDELKAAEMDSANDEAHRRPISLTLIKHLSNPHATTTLTRKQSRTATPSPEAVRYAEYILNHYARNSHADAVLLAKDMERHGWCAERSNPTKIRKPIL